MTTIEIDATKTPGKYSRAVEKKQAQRDDPVIQIADLAQKEDAARADLLRRAPGQSALQARLGRSAGTSRSRGG